MERFPVELIYLLFFIGVVLYNLLAHQAAKRRREQEAAQEPLPEPEPMETEREEPLPSYWGREPEVVVPVPAPAPAPVRRPIVVEQPIAPPVVKKRRPSRARALLGTQRDLRRAIIVMTVLGPCRGVEPHPMRETRLP